MAALVRALLFLVATAPRALASRGLAASLNAPYPALALQRGIVDWSDPGMRDLVGDFTATMWVRSPAIIERSMLLQIVSQEDENMMQPYLTRAALGGNFFLQSSSAGRGDLKAIFWGFVAVTLNGTRLEVSYNAEVVMDFVFDHPPTLQQDGTSISIGMHYLPSQTRPELGEMNLYGEVDDVTLWARALSPAELAAAMREPLDVSQPLPPDVVLAYTFDDAECPERESTGTCTEPGYLVPNHGSAGRAYDLIGGLIADDGAPRKTMHAITDPADAAPSISVSAPALHRSTVPLAADAAFLCHVPTVVEMLPGTEIQVPLPQACQAETLLSAPAAFATLTSASGEAIAAGSPIAGEELHLGLPEGVPEGVKAVHLSVRCVDGREHPVQVTLLQRPRLLRSSLDLRGVEAKHVQARVGEFGAAHSGELLEVVLIEPPKQGVLTALNGDTLEPLFEMNAPGQPFAPGGLFWYTPNDEVKGARVDGFKIVYRSPVSRLESDVLEVTFNLLPTDDLPEAEEPTAPWVVAEDTDKGLEIELKSSDPDSYEGLVITALPERGTLFTLSEGVAHPVARPYKSHDVGYDISEQYVYEVRNVSSFWGSGFLPNYHAVTIIGSPHCAHQGFGECGLDDRFEEGTGAYVHVDDIVRVDLRKFRESPTEEELLVLARVTAVHPANEFVNETFDLALLPTFRHDGPGTRRCEVTSLAGYPDDCVPVAADAATRVALGVPKSETRGLQNGAWSPRFRSPVIDPDEKLEFAAAKQGDDALYGNAYLSVHDPIATYLQEGPPRPFTEFVEVAFKHEVFPVHVEIGSPRGAGAIVGISALDSLGKWHSMYSRAVSWQLNAQTSKIDRFAVFEEPQCRPFFKTRELRIEIDTSFDTGIKDWNYIDYIKLSGARGVQPAMLTHPTTRVRYVPDANTNGDDAFAFAASDCGGNALRNSPEAIVPLHVMPRPDAPILRTDAVPPQAHDRPAYYLYNGGSIFGAPAWLDFELRGSDVDNEAVTLEFASLPRFASLVSRGDDGEGSALQAGSNLTQPAVEALARLRYKPEACTERGIPGSGGAFVARDSMVFRAVDETGLARELKVHIDLACEDLGLDSTVNMALLGMCAFNLTLSSLCMAWTLYFRDSIIVRAAQVPFLVVIVLGTIVSSATLVPLTMNDKHGPRAGPAGGNAMASRACSAAFLLYQAGFVLSFGVLFAKIYRLVKIFDVRSVGYTKRERKRGTSTRSVMRMIGIFAALEIFLALLWVVRSPLRFERTVKQFDEQGNALVSAGFCTSEHFGAYISAVLAYHVGLLLFGSLQCYRTMGINSTFSESKYISLALVGSLEVLVLAVPVIVIVSSDPVVVVFIQGGVVALNDLAVLICIFLPKMRFMAQGGFSKVGVGTDLLEWRAEEKKQQRSG